MARVNTTQIAQALGLTSAALEALASGAIVDAYDPRQVAEQVRTRFDLPADEPIDRELARRGVLTDAEGRWLDDVD